MVLAISILPTENYKEICKKVYIPFAAEKTLLSLFNTFLLKCILYIYYPLQFKKNQTNIQALINSGSEVNAIILAYTARLDLKIWLISIGAQKIDKSIF